MIKFNIYLNKLMTLVVIFFQWRFVLNFSYTRAPVNTSLWSLFIPARPGHPFRDACSLFARVTRPAGKPSDDFLMTPGSTRFLYIFFASTAIAIHFFTHTVISPLARCFVLVLSHTLGLLPCGLSFYFNFFFRFPFFLLFLNYTTTPDP